jgi:hypothetical protein
LHDYEILEVLMKRVLVILLFVLILTAAWFRWLDEIDPATVKADFATQKVEFKEKMADFSLKLELSQITTALDKFFSPAEELDEQDYVFEYPTVDFSVEETTEEPEVNYATEETTEVVNPIEELIVESTIFPTETEESVAATTPDQGYPAPMMVPVTIVDSNEPVEVGEAQEEVFDQSAATSTEQPAEVVAVESLDVVSSDTTSEDSEMVFNQLQESVPGSFLPFNLQSVEPLYTTNFVHPETGCDWMGVAGQIFDEDQQPVNGMVVVVEGVTNNTMVELLGYSGLAEAYGPGGYELVLSDVNGPGIFWIQLFGEDGKPLSEIYSFQMDGTCEQNLAVINFTVKTEVQSKFVPTVNP